jgi:AcrR family transcriptional regulator
MGDQATEKVLAQIETYAGPTKPNDCEHDIVAPSARAARAERRRRQVLDAANAVFRRHGFHGASMAQVAAEAGMSVGHIYRYFENKEAVIAAIVDEDLKSARETMARMTQDPAGVPAAILAGVDEGVAKMLDRADAALFLEVMAEAARNPKIAESAQLQHQSMRECLSWLFEGPPRPGARFSPRQAMDLMNLVFMGLRVRAIQDPGAKVADLVPTIRAFMAELTGAPDLSPSDCKTDPTTRPSKASKAL